MKTIPAHPLAELFPPMTNQEFKDLVDDIKRGGLESPVMLHEGKILDGRHRYRACIIAGVQPKLSEYRGHDPLAFVISKNLKRRHLSPSQLAMVGAKLSNMPPHRPENKSANLPTSQAQAAKTLGISTRSVTTAAKVAKESPALASKVEAGETTVHAAAKQIAEAKKQASPAVQKDKENYPIPSKILALWNRAEAESSGALALLGKLKSALKSAEAESDIIYRELEFQENLGFLSQLHGNLKRVAPHAVCTLCQGVLPDKCQLCKGRGFLSAFAYKMYADDRAKAIRAKSLK